MLNWKKSTRGKDPEPDPDASAASIGFLRKPYVSATTAARALLGHWGTRQRGGWAERAPVPQHSGGPAPGADEMKHAGY